MKIQSHEELIKKDGGILDYTVGDSMLPMLRDHRDIVVISVVHKPLKKYDVPLYRRDSGKLVLHRIIKIKNGEYLTRGDNRTGLEHGVCDRHIIGVLTGFYRDEKYVSCESRGYKLYVAVWQLVYPIRWLYRMVRAVMKRLG